MQFLIWLENTGLSVWIRETPSLWGFPFILFLHTLGLAMLAGINSAFMLWVLSLADKYPLAPMERYFPAMWLGLAVNTISGLLLLIAYPAKALTNPVFYAKLIAIAVALAFTADIRRRLFVQADATVATRPDGGVRRAAGVVLLMWLVATTTGRFLAYTHSILMASQPGFF
jgi:hypothetical protein